MRIPYKSIIYKVSFLLTSIILYIWIYLITFLFRINFENNNNNNRLNTNQHRSNTSNNGSKPFRLNSASSDSQTNKVTNILKLDEDDANNLTKLETILEQPKNEEKQSENNESSESMYELNIEDM